MTEAPNKKKQDRGYEPQAPLSARHTRAQEMPPSRAGGLLHILPPVWTAWTTSSSYRLHNRASLPLLLLLLGLHCSVCTAFLAPSTPRASSSSPAPPLTAMSASSAADTSSTPITGRQTLLSFLHEAQQAQPDLIDEDLHLVLAAMSSAVKRVSFAVRRAGIVDLTGETDAATTNQGGDKQKKLDVVANEMIKEAMAGCGHVAALASEEEDGVVPLTKGGKFLVVMDPLDGSSNVDASIPTGTIFGVYRNLGDSPEELLAGALQKGRDQVAAGYCLFSAATLLVLTMGRGTGTHVFTLDTNVGDFVLTTRRLQMPARGGSYSLNEARYEDWPGGLQKYITDIKQGLGQSKTPYALVYVCSLVADAHWVMIRGGMACNPRSHLRLIYEGNPMGLVIEEAGGLASQGDSGPRILDVEPTAVHQRIPVFLGSREDILELESYGEVSQKGTKKYAV